MSFVLTNFMSESARTLSVLYSFLIAVHTFNILTSTQHRWIKRINMRSRPHSTISCLSRDLSFGSRCYAEVLSLWAEILCWKKILSPLQILTNKPRNIFTQQNLEMCEVFLLLLLLLMMMVTMIFFSLYPKKDFSIYGNRLLLLLPHVRYQIIWIYQKSHDLIDWWLTSDQNSKKLQSQDCKMQWDSVSICIKCVLCFVFSIVYIQQFTASWESQEGYTVVTQTYYIDRKSLTVCACVCRYVHTDIFLKQKQLPCLRSL